MTIFVPLLLDKVVSMLKHIMEVVKGNTEFIEVDQTPRTWRVSLNVWDHVYLHYWLNWVHEDC